MKLHEVRPGMVMFHCPGCKYHHVVLVDPADSRSWGFNGSFDRPTFNPSYRVYDPADPATGRPERTLCHSFVVDGQIQFLPDCAHGLAGQTVELPEWEED